MKKIIFWLIAISICLWTSCKGQTVKSEQISYTARPKSDSNRLRDKGIVFFSKDNGLSWHNQSEGIPDSVFLTDLDFSDSILAVSTKQHGIYLFDFLLKKWNTILNNKLTPYDIDALLISNGKIYIGSHGDGVFITENKGESWKKTNLGLQNLTIRKLVKIGNSIYAGTNGGLYALDEGQNVWKKVFDDNNLQINGIAFKDNDIYIGTNRGAYKTHINNQWKLMLPNRSLHNISVVKEVIYAMVYSELFISKDNGDTWVSDQNGMPRGMYSFQVMGFGTNVFDGQWDGIYKKEPYLNWVKLKGLPEKIPITEMKASNGLFVATSSQWYSTVSQ